MKDFKKTCTILKHCLVKNKKPTKVVFTVTDTCNSHCKHCNIWRQKPTENLLTIQEIATFFSDPYLSEVNEIIITGGEPTTRLDIKEVLLTIHKALPNAAISFSTNGLMPYTTAKLIREVMQEGLTNLAVGTSLDYIGEKHDQIRGTPNSYRKVIHLIRLLKIIRKEFPTLQIGFGTVLQEDNQDNIEEIIQFANDNGLFYLIQWMNDAPFYGGDTRSKKADPVKERDIVSNLPERFNMLKEMWLDKLNGKPIKFNCFALRDFFILKCNGDIVPCLTYWDEYIGNIRREPVEEILTRRNGCLGKDVVSRCPGCLNSWGTLWSFEADGVPYLKYYLKHPSKLWRKLI